MSEKMTIEELRNTLAHCHGSEKVFRYKFLNSHMKVNVEGTKVGMFYSEGVQLLAKHAGAYWLLDMIFSHIKKVLDCEKCHSLTVFTLSKNPDDNGAVFTAAYDSGVKPVVTQEIEFTDFPLFENGKFKLYGSLTYVGEEIGFNVYLPSEY